MITDKLNIELKHTADEVYNYIDDVYNKFPLHPILDSKPILFFRLLVIDGYEAAKETITNDFKGSGKLNLGDAMGPFTATSLIKPDKYLFTMKSKIFTLETGYEIKKIEGGSLLSFCLYADSTSFKQKVTWLFLKPVHRLFAAQVLKNIKFDLNKHHL